MFFSFVLSGKVKVSGCTAYLNPFSTSYTKMINSPKEHDEG